MSKWVYLSHFLDIATPAYGGGEAFQVQAVKSIDNGDTSNTARWTLLNHAGTHLDFPRHFVKYGKTFSDYPPDYWILQSIHLIDISPVGKAGIIDTQKLNIEIIPTETELLLIKTGFGIHRGADNYWKAGPVFKPELASALRRRCPDLKIMGFDTISLSSWSNRELGRAAHRDFLDHDMPILPLEDMDLHLVDSATSFMRVIVSPMPVSNADASPCLVLAEVEG